MTTGQVPKIAGHLLGSRARAARTARGFIAFAILTLASVWPAEMPMAQTAAPDAVVPPVKRERPSEAPAKSTSPPASEKPSGQPSAPATPSDAADAEPYSVPDTGILGTVQDWLARANREYQGIVVKELSTPSSGPATAQGDPIAKKLDEQQQDDARKAADAKAVDDARAAEAKRLAEDRRRAAETKRMADEASRKADEILKDVAPRPEAQKPATDTAEEQRREAQKVADENRRQEERQKAEEQRRADAERKRAEAAKAEAQRIADEHRRADEAAASQMHRRRTIVLTPEPIERPEPRSTLARPELASPGALRVASAVSDRPMIVERPHAGQRVKPWVRRIETAGRCHGAGRRVSLPGRYTVRRGDSLWRISKRHYHKGKFYRKIYAANRGRIRDPDLIYPCQRVFVPRKRR